MANEVPREKQPDAPISSVFTGNFSLGGIGILIDRWANLFPAMGKEVPKVQARLLLELDERQLPNISIRAVNAYPGFLSSVTSMVGGSDERPYIIVQTDPGVLCAVYIDEYGSNLYASWRTHVKGVINKRLFALLAAASAVPSLCIAPCAILVGTVQSGIGGIFGGGGSRFDLGGAILPILGVFAGFFTMGLFFMAFAGYFLQGNIFYYFFVEPNVFDAEDITALSIAVHQALLNAIDKAGIDVTQVEPKKFQSGRRSERL